MDYRKYIGKREQVVLPYFQGQRVEGPNGSFRLGGPVEPGFHLFELRGRVAHPVEAAVAPELSRLSPVRGHLFQDMIVREGAVAEPLQFLPAGELPRFSPLLARRWSSGDLIFETMDFESAAEETARGCYQDGEALKTSGAPATLRAAFGYAVVSRESQRLGIPFQPAEVRYSILGISDEGAPRAAACLQDLLRRREEHHRHRVLAAAIPQPLADRDEGRVATALQAVGARLRDLRRLEGDLLEVSYQFLGSRFVTIVQRDSLQVVDAGICLDGADYELTLHSLPGAIREAMETSRLVVTGHEW